MAGRTGPPARGGRGRLGRWRSDDHEEPSEAVLKRCLQCGAVVTFHPEESTGGGERTPRVRAACGECGAVHRLLTDFDVYGLVERH